MPYPVISVPPFPNVPALPGVPPLLRDAAQTQINAVLTRALLAAGDALGVQFTTGRGPWGLYDSEGVPTVTADSVVSIGYRAESQVSNFPVEGGQFASYNKVTTPFSGRVQLSRGGSDADRTEFLDQLELAKRSLNLFTLVTPEKSYFNVNVVSYTYDRSASAGARLIVAEVVCEEIRIAPSAVLVDTQTPEGQTEENTGPTQTQDGPDPTIGIY